jgi:hypothetical protein
MTIDFCYCTYRKDLSWICYSMQLLYKHFRGPFRTIVVAEEDCRPTIATWGLPVTYHYIRPWPDGYHHAMYRKLMMDTLSDADILCLLDSDHMLMEPGFYLEDFLDHGKPIVHYRNWDDDPNDHVLAVSREQWAPPTERCLGIPLDRDYMVGPPFVFWRDTFAKVRQRIEEVTGQPLYNVCYSDRPYDYRNFLQHPKRFCDYEALGLYASHFEPDRYALHHFPRGTHWPWRVYWSHGDWSASLQSKLDTLLAA